MGTLMKRISVTIPNELEKDLDKLKQEKFYNKPQSEMLRYLIRLGLQKSKEIKYIDKKGE